MQRPARDNEARGNKGTLPQPDRRRCATLSVGRRHLWVAEAARGAGHGRRLMEDAEAYARSRGAVGATVETHSFQARPFYERLGYQVFGTLDTGILLDISSSS
jgi:GNAT superfamily N-acetyltransferase